MLNNYDAKDFGKVVVLMGGLAAEREISLVSGNNILDALLRYGVDAQGLDVQEDVVEKLLRIKPNRAFIALHGPGGEDGSIQGLLEYLNIPYTGSGVIGSAITMEKTFTKLIWQRTGIPTPEFHLVPDIEVAIKMMQTYSLPLCVKPASEGSSVGLTKVTQPEQLPEAFEKAALTGSTVIIEPWIEGTEYTVGILGNKALPTVEIQTPRAFYDFEAKYNDAATRYLCPCDIKPEREKEIQRLALEAFQVTGCFGWGRVDLKEDWLGNLWFLEVNTVPGMTDHSLVPKAAQALGISFDELVVEILGQTLSANNS